MDQTQYEPVLTIDRRPLAEQAVSILRDMIVEGALASGSRLNERILSERLGISRTPLREALKTLATEGLVTLLPNRRAVVAVIDVEELAEIFEVLGALEGLAGELACARASDADIAAIAALHDQMRVHYSRGELAEYFRRNQQIHERIVGAAGNAALRDAYGKLGGRVRRARYMANLSNERWAKAMDEHEQILDALRRRDAPRIRDLLSRHLKNKFEVVRGALAQDSARAQPAA